MLGMKMSICKDQVGLGWSWVPMSPLQKSPSPGMVGPILFREGLEGGREAWEGESGQGDRSESRRMVPQEPRVNTSPFE